MIPMQFSTNYVFVKHHELLWFLCWAVADLKNWLIYLNKSACVCKCVPADLMLSDCMDFLAIDQAQKSFLVLATSDNWVSKSNNRVWMQPPLHLCVFDRFSILFLSSQIGFSPCLDLWDKRGHAVRISFKCTLYIEWVGQMIYVYVFTSADIDRQTVIEVCCPLRSCLIWNLRQKVEQNRSHLDL